MPQKAKIRETVTSHPHLHAKLQEIAQESEKLLDLLRRLPKLSVKAQQEVEPELYVVLAVLQAKTTSALREWDRVVDEELAEEL